MELADLEREFLRKLLGESWVSPPTFDLEIVGRSAAGTFLTAAPRFAHGQRSRPRRRRAATRPSRQGASRWPPSPSCVVDRFANTASAASVKQVLSARNSGN